MGRLTLALALVIACATASGAGLDDVVPAATNRVIVRLAPRAAWSDLEPDLRSANARLDTILTPTPLRVLGRGQSPADGVRLAAALEGSGRVAYAVPETFRPMELRARYVPNDPLFAAQWALDNTGQVEPTTGGDIDAPQA